MTEPMVGRQPIFNGRSEVVAYELLVRPVELFRLGLSDAELTAHTLVHSLMHIGLEQLGSGHRLFLNVDSEFLRHDFSAMLPPERVAFEILESVRVDDELIETCRQLKSRGYSIILDDFVFAPQWEPLLAMAEIVKIDIQATPDLPALLQKLSRYKALLLAERVETREELERMHRLGFTLFQGYFFCRPEVVRGRAVSSNRIAIMQVMEKIIAAESFGEIEHCIVQDMGLSYRLLKYLNSPYFGRDNEIESVHQALYLLGFNHLRNWITLVSLSAFGNDKPVELLRQAMFRGRLMDCVGRLSHRIDDSNAFLLGLFSLLDVLLDKPMGVAVEQIKLPEKVMRGLFDPESELGRLLQLVLAYERSDYEAVLTLCAQLQIDSAQLAQCYVESITWLEHSFSRL